MSKFYITEKYQQKGLQPANTSMKPSSVASGSLFFGGMFQMEFSGKLAQASFQILPEVLSLARMDIWLLLLLCVSKP